MGIYVANQVIKLMIKKGHKIYGSKVLILGITFKENCPDIRNSKVIDVVKELQDFGCEVSVADCYADPEEVQHEYGIKLLENTVFSDYEAIVLAVAHDEYKKLSSFDNKKQVVFDIKNVTECADGRL
jgi:UDP-N-acetyl-D-galactosamine dehydrogenase